MKDKAIKAVKVIGVVALVGFMINTLLMLAQLKGLDSKLSENGRLLSEAVRFEESMGAKGEQISEMAVIFSDIAGKMETVNATARSIASDGGNIRTMNDELLAVNREIDAVILDNITMAREMSSRMSEVVSIMGDVGGMLGGITSAASQQLGKIGDMYRLAQENNASVPALP
ncbi:MAG: hypothetical protein PHP28_13535 [Actinomycetota bacterium]|nr:hypothetical protein [Actinomycetota bacterium]MDD5667864.1 hypothetical protein [Actinomycetota bacterium]